MSRIRRAMFLEIVICLVLVFYGILWVKPVEAMIIEKDPSFGDNGVLSWKPANDEVSPQHQVAKSVIQWDDGYIVVAQGNNICPAVSFCVYLFKIDKSGKLDTSWGNNGYLLMSDRTFLQGTFKYDQYIYLLLEWGNWSSDDYRLMRVILSDGIIDGSYGGGKGYAKIPTLDSILYFADDVVLNQDKLYISSQLLYSPSSSIVSQITRMSLDGTQTEADKDFGFSIPITTGNAHFVSKCPLIFGDSIYLPVRVQTSPYHHTVIFKYTLDGKQDVSFGSGSCPTYGDENNSGCIEISAENGPVYPYTILKKDSDLFLVGSYPNSENGEEENLTIWKLDEDGILDTSWKIMVGIV